MKRTPKYVGLDVHQATTLAAVREETGRMIARTLLPTDAHALVECFRGMRGPIHVAFEEGTQSQWSHDLLEPIVDQIIVCDRRGQTTPGSKSDRGDAELLADLLRRGGLRAVYHGSPQRASLSRWAWHPRVPGVPHRHRLGRRPRAHRFAHAGGRHRLLHPDARLARQLGPSD
jgi:hypothetical protein